MIGSLYDDLTARRHAVLSTSSALLLPLGSRARGSDYCPSIPSFSCAYPVDTAAHVRLLATAPHRWYPEPLLPRSTADQRYRFKREEHTAAPHTTLRESQSEPSKQGR
ncbi:hypothetical protein EXIGLDRAFT_424496 [Exidia glandulosa HHB12029]|uniref:Uncharacterized protein n=1 Tax=Exidia glandulosa HHB12029 TaxID=1314781 RepID=A0A165KKH8_EXIGL|nr:hypothetical protein EXIGLDRAFT_424496 [Exidia glandulosa HHB12029]